MRSARLPTFFLALRLADLAARDTCPEITGVGVRLRLEGLVELKTVSSRTALCLCLTSTLIAVQSFVFFEHFPVNQAVEFRF